MAEQIATNIVYKAIDLINEDPNLGVKFEKNASFMLMDEGSLVDSLSLVNFFVNLEALIEQEANKSVSLINENSFESNMEPFKNIGNLISYVTTLIKD